MAAQNDSPTPQWAATRLEFQCLLQVAGPDHLQFLQGQLTQDVRQVTAVRSALSGWSDAQGKLQLVGQVIHWRDSLWLSVPAALAEKLAARLRLFVLRSRVTISISDLVLTGLLGPQPAGLLPAGIPGLAADALACASGADWFATRVAGDPSRVLVSGTPETTSALLEDLQAAAASPGDWLQADIRVGLPAIGTETCERFIPQMVNLDLLGGVSFSKGCYTGQEIITRTRHLGRVKRRMLRFLCRDAVVLEAGGTIYGPEREAGQVISAVATARGLELLAVTRLSDLAGPLFADADRHMRLERLDLPYAIPEEVTLPSG